MGWIPISELFKNKQTKSDELHAANPGPAGLLCNVTHTTVI